MCGASLVSIIRQLLPELGCPDHPCIIGAVAVQATVCSMVPFQSTNIYARGVDAATFAAPCALLAEVAKVEPV